MLAKMEELSKTAPLPGISTSCFPFAADDGSPSFRSSASIEIQICRILGEIESTIEIYDDCFRRLQVAVADLESLRLVNKRLSDDYFELVLLVDVVEASVTPDPLQVAELAQAIPGGGVAEKRNAAPKSISIRSTGYLSVRNSPSSRRDGGESSRTHRLLLPVNGGGGMDSEIEGDDGGGGGDGEEEEEVLVEVFNQGMEKTEMCNKWETMGWCPYGPRCRFAHGMEELRPVVRHPRYKTQICRLLATGCPYGHRCHFRHSLPHSDT